NVLGSRYHRYRRFAAAWISDRLAEVGVVRLLRVVRGENADVAGPHLAAGRARRGADRGLGDPRGDTPEDGRGRFPAFPPADVPGREPRVRAADFHALGRRHHLHLAGRADAGGREKADRLFLGGPHGLCHHGNFRGYHAGHRRRDLPDDLAWHRFRRAV